MPDDINNLCNLFLRESYYLKTFACLVLRFMLF